MKVRESLITGCAFSAAIEIAKEYFECCDEPGLTPMGSSSARSRRSCISVIDHTDRARHHEALRLNWCDHHSLCPASFEGLLTVRPASGRVELILESELNETVVVRQLLRVLACYVEEQWELFVRKTPTIETCNASSRPGMALV